MGILPVGIKWEVTINTHPHRKLFADVYIFRRKEDSVDTFKQLKFLGTTENGDTKYRIEEDVAVGISMAPSLQLPWEVLEPLAQALREMGVDGGGDSKMAGKIEAQEAHLRDLRDIALSFITCTKPPFSIKTLQPEEENKT